MKRLILVRHAEPEWPSGQAIGRRDPPLSAEGREQARALARALSDQPVAQVFSSSRARAVQTGESIAELQRIPVEVPPEDFFNDFAIGDWEGRPQAELQADPLFQAFLSDPAGVIPPGAPESVESLHHLQDRVEAGLRRVFEAVGDADCGLVVTHADIVRIALTSLLDIDATRFLRFAVPRASITVVEKPLEKPTLSRLGWTTGDDL
ncbi:putative phosphoglycerate mutase [Microbacterium sp. BK668]|nr:putative phosphoglycerate mutase [Microbacterium sp. BK668]